ncbi:hypothetical protein N7466_001253 [Penicillium verhagenii]|uniref:uncharacterized protein n=1 Tax=Penicillium verhagenii TaxID=1562060 RepID=UPI0025450A8D|nr:uncharacterized protein N7466_001253 [Penicillium verhagenii]KAJ5948238.1 hypothetical protein N7466_001253 [Penicillium verhagenii]
MIDTQVISSKSHYRVWGNRSRDPIYACRTHESDSRPKNCALFLQFSSSTNYQLISIIPEREV